jgi:two-component system CheB/CheR fusion protein
MPYRTLDDRIDGLVITFINTSDFKKVELKLHETDQALQVIFNLSSDAVIKLTSDLKILEFNPEAEKFFGKNRKEVINSDFILLFIPEHSQKKGEADMKSLLNQNVNGTLKMKVKAAGDNTPVYDWSFNILRNTLEMPTGIILSLKTKQIHE